MQHDVDYQAALPNTTSTQQFTHTSTHTLYSSRYTFSKQTEPIHLPPNVKRRLHNEKKEETMNERHCQCPVPAIGSIR